MEQEMLDRPFRSVHWRSSAELHLNELQQEASVSGIQARRTFTCGQIHSLRRNCFILVLAV